MTLKSIIYSFLLLSLTNGVFAQEVMVAMNGELVPGFITEENDTVLMASFEEVDISSPYAFADKDEHRKYLKYRKYAAVVYPYAVEAIKTFKEIRQDTDGMKKQKRKKHVKRIHKKLKKEFHDPLKELTKTQGYLLIKMVEKEIDEPLYYIIKDYRGSWTAGLWNAVGSLNGYKLKDGYIPGNDRILDMVLEDYDLTPGEE